MRVDVANRDWALDQPQTAFCGGQWFRDQDNNRQTSTATTKHTRDLQFCVDTHISVCLELDPLFNSQRGGGPGLRKSRSAHIKIA